MPAKSLIYETDSGSKITDSKYTIILLFAIKEDPSCEKAIFLKVASYLIN